MSNKTQQYTQYNNKPKSTNNNINNSYIIRFNIRDDFSDNTVLFSNSNIIKNWRYYSQHIYSNIHNNIIISFVLEDNFNLYIEGMLKSTLRGNNGYILIPSPSGEGVFLLWTAKLTDTKTNKTSRNGNQEKIRISEINHLSLNFFIYFSYSFYCYFPL